jgi:chromosome segregation protein
VAEVKPAEISTRPNPRPRYAVDSAGPPQEIWRTDNRCGIGLPLHFTRLRLLGFKSFVDPTELLITPGLTGVVGPNGCGKSNLLEALRWVMGENRPSVMRGDGMEDVIFAGSAARPARNFAEVTLTIDNRDRRAPAGFNDADELAIVRRITRDAGSAYRVAGREARARDVAILFADASTGSQSPALVRQGQISELINARPKARRRILEEAAGISGLYQRRHEAELKLRATEANLARVADVLEALETQLASLARQARQAARYRELAEGLRRTEALLLWRQWHDAETARAEAAAALTAALGTAGAAEAEASAAGRRRAEADAAMPGLRDEDAIAGAVLQRLVLERDRLDAEAAAAEREIVGLDAQARQLAADREREAALDRDAVAMEARLAEEAATLAAEHAGHDAALEVARAAAEAAAEALAAVEQAFDGRAEAAARLAAEHQTAERAVAETRRRSADAARARDSAEAACAAAAHERAVARETRADAAEAAEAAAARAFDAEAALADAEAQAAATRATEAVSRSRLSEAEGAARALAAEAAGLEALLARPSGEATPALDSVAAAPGSEVALGAALGEDLALPLADASDPSGWRTLPRLEVRALPAGAAPLAPEVAAPAALARALDAVGLVARDQGARLQPLLAPGQRLVSREGDLWRWDGLVVPAGAAPSAAALRLQQRNRLAELREAEARADAARAAARADQAEAARAQAEAGAAETAARTARKAAEQAAAETARALGRAETTLEALEARVATLQAAVARRSEDLAAAQAAEAEAGRALAALADPAAARAAVDAERLRVEAARLTMLTRRAEADELERAGAARQRRRAEIAREAESWSSRRASAGTRLADLDRRAAATAAALDTARERPPALAARREELAAAAEDAEARRRRAADALALGETALRSADAAARSAERAAGEAREARARAGALAEAAEARSDAATERLAAEVGSAPGELLAALGVEATAVAAVAVLEAEAERLRRARDGLGAVNLRAEEDARALRDEHETLTRERADLEEAISKLRHGIATLNREGRGRLVAAFDEVNRNFATLFRHLFGGGEANLVLVEDEDPLEAGLEIMAQPPGKKLATLSLLSGGEQTLTALSLIFAVFLANPSPICVLDEVDAPLDDANVGRFCDLLDEMTRRTDTRFLIITHHAVTMARMDRLFGVTMAEQGVSQLVSVDLAAAARIVENA